MTKLVKIYTTCPICNGKIWVGLTVEQLEAAHKALEKQKALDLTKEILRKTGLPIPRGID